MARYRKLPVHVEAHQWFKNGDHPEDGPSGREGSVVRYYRDPDTPDEWGCGVCGKAARDHGWIDTLEAGHRVCPGDWIVTGVQGERYPVKDPIFRATYEEVAAR